MKFFLFLLFLSSCTTVRKAPLDRYSLLVFEPGIEVKDMHVSSNLHIKYRSCFTRWAGEGFDYLTPLKKQFEEKFQEKLIGFANLEVETIKVGDSSIFTPNEMCKHLVANPVTKNPLNVREKESFIVDDQRGHVH